jgi:hypothetical protein
MASTHVGEGEGEEEGADFTEEEMGGEREGGGGGGSRGGGRPAISTCEACESWA